MAPSRANQVRAAAGPQPCPQTARPDRTGTRTNFSYQLCPTSSSVDDHLLRGCGHSVRQPRAAGALQAALSLPPASPARDSEVRAVETMVETPQGAPVGPGPASRSAGSQVQGGFNRTKRNTRWRGRRRSSRRGPNDIFIAWAAPLLSCGAEWPAYSRSIARQGGTLGKKVSARGSTAGLTRPHQAPKGSTHSEGGDAHRQCLKARPAEAAVGNRPRRCRLWRWPNEGIQAGEVQGGRVEEAQPKGK